MDGSDYYLLKDMQSVDSEGRNRQQKNPHQDVPLKLLLLITFAFQGVYRYIPGPTLIDLFAQTDEDLHYIPLVFTARAVGYIVGFILGKCLFPWLPHSYQKTLFLFLMVFLLAVSSFAISLVNTLKGLLLAFCAAGFCTSVLDSGNDAICLQSKVSATSTFYLVLQFFHGLGAFTGLYFAKSFATHSVYLSSIRSEEHRVWTNHPVWKFRKVTTIYRVYIAIGCFIFIVGLFWLAHYFSANFDLFQNMQEADQKDSKFEITRSLSIFNASILIFVSESVAFSYAEMLPIISALVLHDKQVLGVDTMILFCGCFCVGRLILICIPTNISHNMLIIGNGLMFCGSILMYIPLEDYVFYFWLENGMIGLGVGPLLPCVYSWLQQKLYFPYHSATPLFIMGALSELIVPWLIVWYVFSNPPDVKHFLLAASLIHFAFLMGQYFLFNAVDKKNKIPTRIQISEAMPSRSLVESVIPLENVIPQIFPQSPPQVGTLTMDNDTVNPTKTRSGIFQLRQRIEENNQKIVLFMTTMDSIGMK